MKRTRVAGIIPMNGGFVLMHRMNVKKERSYTEYYTFPGGGLEEGETPEEGTIREVKEEFGIDVKIMKKMYEFYSEELQQNEIFYLCQYVGGEFGTGTGEEFSNSPHYVDRGNYIPEIVKREDMESILLLPPEIKERFLEDMDRIVE